MIAHRIVEVVVFGPARTLLLHLSLYCDLGEIGRRTVAKWAREEARRQGIQLGGWDYLRPAGYPVETRWEGRVYGAPVKE